MNLNLFKITVWEDNKLADKMGIVMGDTLSDAAENLENYFESIEEISYLSPIGITMVYELDIPSYIHFSEIKNNFCW